MNTHLNLFQLSNGDLFFRCMSTAAKILCKVRDPKTPKKSSFLSGRATKKGGGLNGRATKTKRTFH